MLDRVQRRDLQPPRAAAQRLMARGHRFRTASDTEAILHAYEEFGPACVDRLEGMFAFAIYDAAAARAVHRARSPGQEAAVLRGARRRAALRQRDQGALRRAPRGTATLDLSALEGYLSLGYFLAPGTIYRHVRKLEPGHWLRLRDGRIETRQYWDVDRRSTTSAARRAGRSGRDRATCCAARSRDRLESEVPLGAFLSGGIDSGLVVSYMAEALGGRLITTSVGFGERGAQRAGGGGADRGAFRDRASRRARSSRNLDEVLDPIVGAFDEPFADASAIPTSTCRAMARRHVTVALSGDGGDETFGGYDFRYVPHAVEARCAVSADGAVAAAVGSGTRVAAANGCRAAAAGTLPREHRRAIRRPPTTSICAF